MIKLFHPYIPEEFYSGLTDVLASGWIGNAGVVEQFEKDFAEYMGAKYAVMTNSATSALNVAVEVSGLKEGDEVLTTPITFVSTNHAILNVNAIPVFVDVDPYTLNIDLNKAEAAITSKTKAIMAVHYGGNPIDMPKLYGLARQYNLRVIEDAAHACGAKYGGYNIGSFGLTCFSLSAVKNLPVGDGGMITTNHGGQYHHIRSLMWLGIDKTTYARSKSQYKWEYDVTNVGYKYASNDIAASLGIQGLRKLDEWNEYRADLVRTYKENIPHLKWLQSTPNSVSANHLFVIKVDRRDYVHKKLLEAGIETGVHYKPNHHYPMYRLPDEAEKLWSADLAYSRILSLPLHLRLTTDDVIHICNTLKEIIC